MLCNILHVRSKILRRTSTLITAAGTVSSVISVLARVPQSCLRPAVEDNDIVPA